MTTTTELVAMVSFTGDPELIVLPYDVDFELDDDEVMVEVYRSAQTEPVHVEPWNVVDEADGMPVFDPTAAQDMLIEAGYYLAVGKWEPTNDGYCRTVKVIA